MNKKITFSNCLKFKESVWVPTRKVHLRLRESIRLSSDFHSQSIIKCDLSQAAFFAFCLSASVAIECENNAAREIIMKTDWSYFTGKSGVLYFRTTIQRQEWTPFILGTEDLKKNNTKQNKKKLIRSTGKKKKCRKTSVLCARSFPAAMSEKSPLSTVSCGCHSRCAVSSQARLSFKRHNEFLTFTQSNALSVAPCFNAGIQTLRTQKNRVRNPLLDVSLNATFQDVIRGKRGATLRSSFPCLPRRRAIKGDKAGAAEIREGRKHTQNTHHTSVAETTAGRFQSKTWESGKKKERK